MCCPSQLPVIFLPNKSNLPQVSSCHHILWHSMASNFRVCYDRSFRIDCGAHRSYEQLYRRGGQELYLIRPHRCCSQRHLGFCSNLLEAGLNLICRELDWSDEKLLPWTVHGSHFSCSSPNRATLLFVRLELVIVKQEIAHFYPSVTVSMNIVSMVVILTPSVPPIIHAMFTVPNVALQNVMACRVYRLLKLGLINDDPKSYSMKSDDVHLRCIVKNSDNVSESLARQNLTTGASDASSAFTVHNVIQSDKALPLHIEIRRDSEIRIDHKECLGAGDAV